MKGLATVLGIVMLGVAAGPAAGQTLRVEVGVNAPPISARVVLGHPIFAWYGYGDLGLWRTDPYLARLYRQHMIWLARERQRFAAMRPDRWGYRQFMQAHERERIARERVLTREYQRWAREHDRSRGREWDRGRSRDRGHNTWRGGRH